MSRILTGPIRAYQLVVSPMFGRRCRFHPTCSEYAVLAIRQLGPARGTLAAAWRLLRCNPWSDGGVDYPPHRKPAGT